MMLNVYLTLHRLILLFHYTLSPVVLLLSYLVPFLAKRRKFESVGGTSFKKNGIKASYCFHVSSEGELEQSLPIIKKFLEQDLYIELVYTSDSVAKKCELLGAKYPHLNILRMPLVCFPVISFRRWVTAKTFFMCRYDFFSELVLYGSRKDIKFILLSASLKGKNLTGVKKYLTKGLYRCFDLIISASDIEMRNFLALDQSLNIRSYEFRLLQIKERIDSATATLEGIGSLKKFFSCLKSHPVMDTLVIGSAWPVDMGIFKDKSIVEQVLCGRLIITIAPHSLKESSIEKIKDAIREHCPEIKLVDANDVDNFNKGEVYINSTPGILLESYTYFGHVLVGGGHGRSIHSVLEPFLAGARVYCGPRTFRSTEFDFVLNEAPNDMVVVESLENLSKFLVRYNREEEIEKRSKLAQEYKRLFSEIMEMFQC